MYCFLCDWQFGGFFTVYNILCCLLFLLFIFAGAALENLSAGRVGIMGEGTNACCSVVAIAVRYAAVRKQFGPNGNELPILEYQLHVSSPYFPVFVLLLFMWPIWKEFSSIF